MSNYSEDLVVLFSSGIIVIIYLAILLFSFLAIAASFVANWKIFEKAGVEGWKSLIPFYNSYVICEISGTPIWAFILLFVPGANLVGLIFMYLNLAKSFNKDVMYAMGLIFLSPIFQLMLAFGDAKYIGPMEF